MKCKASFKNPGLPMLFLLLLAILTATVGGYEGNSTNNSGPIIIKQTGHPMEGQLFITINPISDQYMGDTFFITGTTNVPLNTPIIVEVFCDTFHPHGKTQPGQFVYAINSATVRDEPGNVNTWEVVINTSGYNDVELGTWNAVVSPRLSSTPESLRYQNVSKFKFSEGVRSVTSTAPYQETVTVTSMKITQSEPVATTPTRSPITGLTVLTGIIVGTVFFIYKNRKYEK